MRGRLGRSGSASDSGRRLDVIREAIPSLGLNTEFSSSFGLRASARAALAGLERVARHEVDEIGYRARLGSRSHEPALQGMSSTVRSTSTSEPSDPHIQSRIHFCYAKGTGVQ